MRTSISLLFMLLGLLFLVPDNAEAQAIPSLSINDVSLPEGNGGATNFKFTVTLSFPSPTPVEFDLATANGTAIAGQDYNPVTVHLMMPPGATSIDIIVSAVGDILNEADDVFFVNLSNPKNATIADPQAAGTIINDDPQPTLTIDDGSLIEGNAGIQNLMFTVRLNVASGKTVTVNFSTLDGSATTAGNDYNAASGILTFPPGSVSQTIPVGVKGDNNVEPDETFTVNLSGPSGAALLRANAVGTIRNDDVGSPVIFSKPVPDILRDKEYLTCEIGNFEEPSRIHNWKLFYRGAGPISTNLVVVATTVNVAESGAIKATLIDETGLKTITVNHPSTMTDATGLLPLSLIGGKIYTLTIERINPSSGPVSHHYKLGSPDRKLELGWDDPLRYLEAHTQLWSINGDAGENVVVEFFTDAVAFPPQASHITANLELPSGAVIAGPSTFAPNGSLTIPGFIGGSIVIRVTGDGHFRIRKISGSDRGVYALPCPELEKPIEMSMSGSTVTEGNSGTVNASFTVNLSAASDHTVTVDYATSDGTASAGADYVSKSGTLTFSPGEISKTIDIAVIGETVTERDETFAVTLSNAAGATIVGSLAKGTIVNDDFVSVGFYSSSFSFFDVFSYLEGNSGITNFTFEVKLTGASPDVVTVDYSLVDGTAIGSTSSSSGDYNNTGGTVTFPPGSTSQTITVGVYGDLLVEPDETFEVVLSNPTNATLATSTGWSDRSTGEITNDDTRKYSLTISRNVLGGSVTVNGTDESCASGECSSEQAEGSAITLVAVPSQGWRFVRWEGSCTGTDPTVVFRMDGTKIVRAVFERITHTLAVSIGGPVGTNAVTTSPSPVSGNEYYHGTVVTLTAVPDANSLFSYWDGDASGTSSTVTVTMDADRSVSANFTRRKFSLTIIPPSAGGGVVVNDSKDWCFSVCVSDQDGGSEVTLKAMPNPGWRFVRWEGSCSGTSETVKLTMDAAKTVTAIFEQITHTLAVSIGGPVGTNAVATSPPPVSGNEYYHGTVVTLTAVPDANSLFSYWDGDASGTSSTVTVTMDADRNVSANFEQKKHTLTIIRDPQGGIVLVDGLEGTCLGQSCTATFTTGATVTLTAIPKPGWSFVRWTGASTGTDPRVVVTIDAAKEITGVFERARHTLQVMVAGPAGTNTVTTSPAPVSGNEYYHGTVVTLTSVPDANSLFSSWSGDASGTSSPVTVTMEGDKTVTANFASKQFTLTVSRIGSGIGTVTTREPGLVCDGLGSGCSVTFNSGVFVTLIATPAPGSHFGGWKGGNSGDPEDPNPTITILIDAAKNITARFERNTYTLFATILASAGALGTVTTTPPGIDYGSGPTNSYYEGDVVTLTATPDANSVFRQWSGGIVSTSATTTVTMNSNISVTANFTKKNELQLLQSLQRDLQSLRNATSDKDDAKTLDDVLKSIGTAATASYWFDGDHLQSKQGEKVFDETKNAVNKLRNLLKGKKSLIADATLQSFIDRIIRIDRALVLTAIKEAESGGGDPRSISKANDELAVGDSDVGQSKYESGVEHYRNAWKSALAALPNAGIVTTSDAPGEVELENGIVPAEFGLAHAYPNPFNPSTTIQFDLPQASMVRLSVYNMVGHEVAVLVDREVNAGRHSVRFDAAGLSSGMYFCRIQAGHFRDTRKLLLLK